MKNSMTRLYVLFALLFSLQACNEFKSTATEDKKDSLANTVDSLTYPVDSAAGPVNNDTTQARNDTLVINDTNHKLRHKAKKITRAPASVPEEEVSTGYAMVYCPAKMIRNIPSILYATVSKDEMDSAITKFTDKIKSENPEKKKEKISKDIKGDHIAIYERMGVTIEFDEDDFKKVSGKDNLVKEFGSKKELEWEWILKPIRSTQKSIITFKFFYVDPGDQKNYILEKTISISATVDARSFVNKWTDFLFDDPKTTLTAIIIPLVTFFGGFLTGKRKPKN
jgi:hypothetical protein